MDKRRSDDLSIMEAVDNLSSMAELDMASLAAEAEDTGILEISTEKPAKSRNWFDPKNKQENREVVKQTFRVIKNYLQDVYEKDKTQLKDVETQKGIQAIMLLAGEAAQKVDKFTSIFKEAHEAEGVSSLKEYQDLQQFYLSKIMKRFQQVLEKEEAWQAEWDQVEEDYVDIQRRGLKDLETVKKDNQYELFYILKEDGRPFFNRNLLRHIKLIGDFDETIIDPTGEDPFFKSKIFLDRDAHALAKEILINASAVLADFFKESMRHKESKFVASLNKAMMALMLCANPRNSIQNSEGKNCINYFLDFHNYLRIAISEEEYRKHASSSSSRSDAFSHACIQLIHNVCKCFFVHPNSRKEIVELILRWIRKGKNSLVKKHVHGTGLSIWTSILDDDEQIRALLKKYPNGPLLKTLAAFRSGSEKKGFDPILQGSFPSQLFNITYDENHLTCLKIPSPTRQGKINHAEIVNEFLGFLGSLKSSSNRQKHLVFNLQDRTSWREHARCTALELLQNQSEYTDVLTVISLPKNTDFYLQTENYHKESDAKLFLKEFKEQIASGEECGFYFPAKIDEKKLNEFTSNTLQCIHTVFFSDKKVLTRKNRLDFIEIFYLFLILYLISCVDPDSFSLTCKDAIDIGPAQSASLFAFLKLLSKDASWNEQESNFLIWLLFSQALIVRERMIDANRLHRMVSALAVISAEMELNQQSILKQVQTVLPRSMFKNLQVEY